MAYNLFMESLELVKEKFFQNSLIEISNSLEGNKFQDEKLVLGCRAGPSMSVDNLLHEMAHLIEIPDERIRISGWGMTYPEVEVLGQFFREPQTIQGLRRELRVFAIQKHLFEMAGIPTTESYWSEKAKICEWLQDFILIPSPREDRLRWCMDEMKKYYSSYSVSFLEIEWNRKNNLLK